MLKGIETNFQWAPEGKTNTLNSCVIYAVRGLHAQVALQNWQLATVGGLWIDTWTIIQKIGTFGLLSSCQNTQIKLPDIVDPPYVKRKTDLM